MFYLWLLEGLTGTRLPNTRQQSHLFLFLYPRHLLSSIPKGPWHLLIIKTAAPLLFCLRLPPPGRTSPLEIWPCLESNCSTELFSSWQQCRSLLEITCSLWTHRVQTHILSIDCYRKTTSRLLHWQQQEHGELMQVRMFNPVFLTDICEYVKWGEVYLALTYECCIYIYHLETGIKRVGTFQLCLRMKDMILWWRRFSTGTDKYSLYIVHPAVRKNIPMNISLILLYKWYKHVCLQSLPYHKRISSSIKLIPTSTKNAFGEREREKKKQS